MRAIERPDLSHARQAVIQVQSKKNTYRLRSYSPCIHVAPSPAFWVDLLRINVRKWWYFIVYSCTGRPALFTFCAGIGPCAWATSSKARPGGPRGPPGRAFDDVAHAHGPIPAQNVNNAGLPVQEYTMKYHHFRTLILNRSTQKAGEGATWMHGL